ncbi:protein serine/threonine phosphatase 2C [Gonapodya prolifera JEL478]|uniref:protein-serine/threonine phosphatase n=1 Tax=Gonapodya prolifera (strain JEL478) TaxID=1344416 RepID=A0A139A8F7_GONPJ|nr:protein serine/threonine phosphatase 2C [Gonapodya prolifera JEL478]|eukprot:KXS13091.1 protein serine/threonine phosphatase 2C [Gonapodya prolifera JEL478]
MTAPVDLQVFTHSAQGSRDHQEDRLCIVNDRWRDRKEALFMVFDGHGTSDYAVHACKVLPGLILDSDAFRSGRYSDALADAFLNEDKLLKTDVAEAGTSTSMGMGMAGMTATKTGGTTATVGLVVGSRLYLANVGDSRAIISKSGPSGTRAIRISTDHKPSHTGEHTRLDASSPPAPVIGDRIHVHGHSLNMSRALGDFDYKQPANDASADWVTPAPHISVVEMTNGNEFLVLASDGLWDCFDDGQVMDIITTNKTRGSHIQDIVKVLVEKIAGSPGSDNVTILLVHFKWGEAEAEGEAKNQGVAA